MHQIHTGHLSLVVLLDINTNTAVILDLYNNLTPAFIPFFGDHLHVNTDPQLSEIPLFMSLMFERITSASLSFDLSLFYDFHSKPYMCGNKHWAKFIYAHLQTYSVNDAEPNKSDIKCINVGAQHIGSDMALESNTQHMISFACVRGCDLMKYPCVQANISMVLYVSLL